MPIGCLDPVRVAGVCACALATLIVGTVLIAVPTMLADMARMRDTVDAGMAEFRVCLLSIDEHTVNHTVLV
jgi:hypothetical protein